MRPVQINQMAIAALRPNPKNARTHSRRQIRKLAESIEALGWTYPILADEHGNVIAGHGRLEAAKLLGLTKVPVMTAVGLSEAQKRALAIADNKIAEGAGWDRPTLAAELGELGALLPECNLDLSSPEGPRQTFRAFAATSGSVSEGE